MLKEEETDVKKMIYEYDDDCLDGAGEDRYLVTSCDTGFSIKYLWSVTLDILLHKTSFSAMAEHYNSTHASQRLTSDCDDRTLLHED